MLYPHREANEIQVIPVILHTDIGTDIDDSWALLMMLNQPQFKVLQVLVDTGDTKARAAIAARMLQCAGHSEIEIGLGISDTDKRCPITLANWMRDYSLENYDGRIVEDGIDRMIELIRESPEPVTLISISPPPALAEALRRAPDIVRNVHLVGMFGSVHKGYGGGAPSIEYNVVKDLKATQTLLGAPWLSVTITPLDTCGIVRLTEDEYSEISSHDEPSVKLLIESFDAWKDYNKNSDEFPGVSSILYDTVAVHLASSREFLKMESLKIRVNDEGYTVIDNDAGMSIDCALEWTNLKAYRRLMLNAIMGK